MFQQKLMIAGLRKQHGLLGDLLEDLESEFFEEKKDCDLCHRQAVTIANNLQKLRGIQRSYCLYLDSPDIKTGNDLLGKEISNGNNPS